MAELLARDVYRLLRSTTAHLKGEFRGKIEEFGITWPQYHALYHIGEEGIPANELARELQCNASNMTGLIDRMTEGGWVFREQSERDRRVWLIKLTLDGERLRQAIYPQHWKNIDKRMAVLSSRELAVLKGLLIKLRDGVCKEENI